MTDTLIPPAAVTGPPDADPYGFRPAPSDHGPGRFLRRLIGIREEILDRVPEERPKYTRLGLVVVNTGLMAAASLLVALHQLVDVPLLALVPVGLFWGYVIVTIDSWMISSTHGALGANRLVLFVPRLFIAILIGTAIAEPFLLRIFQPAIHAQVRNTWQQEVTTLGDRLKACNPVGATGAVGSGCDGYRLPVTSPDAARQQLAKLTEQRDRLKAQVDNLNKQLAQKEDFAEKECAGVPGNGRSGRAGRGFRCDRAWEVADRFRDDNRVQGRQAELDRLNSDIKALTASLSGQAASYEEKINQAIAAKLREKRNSHERIGLLDEFHALGQLSDRDGLVLAAQWVLRILLIALDCLPVLAKWLGGKTAYDGLVSARVNAGKNQQHLQLTVQERRGQAIADVDVRRIDHERDLLMQQIDQANRAAQAKEDEEKDAEIDRLAARYARMDPRRATG